MKKYYIFLAFSDDYYNPESLIESKLFINFCEMKNYSSNHSAENKPKYKKYCSTYTKIEI